MLLKKQGSDVEKQKFCMRPDDIILVDIIPVKSAPCGFNRSSDRRRHH